MNSPYYPQVPPQYYPQNGYGQYNGYALYNTYPLYNAHIPKLPINVPALVSTISGSIAILSWGAGLLNFPLYIALIALVIGIIFAVRKTYRNGLMIAASILTTIALFFTLISAVFTAQFFQNNYSLIPSYSTPNYTSSLELAAKGLTAIQQHLELAGEDISVSRVISIPEMNQVRIELSYYEGSGEDTEIIFARYAVVEDSALAGLGWYDSELRVTVYEYSSPAYGEEIDVDDVLSEAEHYGFTW